MTEIQMLIVKNGPDLVMVNFIDISFAAFESGILSFADYRKLASLCKIDAEKFLVQEKHREFPVTSIPKEVIKVFMRGHDLTPSGFRKRMSGSVLAQR